MNDLDCVFVQLESRNVSLSKTAYQSSSFVYTEPKRQIVISVSYLNDKERDLFGNSTFFSFLLNKQTYYLLPAKFQNSLFCTIIQLNRVLKP